ncbi:MAG: hypothetical protein ACLF0G_07015 [Candidatus Brocadiia bacterium]
MPSSRRRPPPEKDPRIERLQRRHRTERQVALALSIGGGLVALLIFVIVVVVSGSSDTKERSRPEVERVVLRDAAGGGKAEEEGGEGLLPPEKAYDLLGHKTRPEDREARPLSRGEKVERSFRAARRLAEEHAEKGHWAKAIKSVEEVLNHWEDHSLLIQGQDYIDELLRRSRTAFETSKSRAERLVRQGRYDPARDIYLGIAESYGRHDSVQGFVDEARRRAEEIYKRKWDEAEADYRARMAPVEEQVDLWQFRKALDLASKLDFKYEKYQKLLAARIERLRGLVALKKKMIDAVDGALPRLKMRDLRFPGADGELVDADEDRILCETQYGEQKFEWPQIGPEAAVRLAVQAGGQDDKDHRLWVARLLMEVGYLDRAREQLELARRLGADVAEEREELRRRRTE